MGKIVEKKKKKGRPSLLDIQKRTLREQQQNQLQTSPNPNSNPNFTIPIISNPNSDPNRRFTRRNPELDEITDAPARIVSGEDDEFDEDSNGRQRGKKFKFVVRLPSQKHNQLSNSPSNGVDSKEESDNSDTLLKKRKIAAVGGRSVYEDGEEEEKHNFASEPSDTPSGMEMEFGPTTPLPNKKLLVFILDRLQKKDTYGVFSEPVNPKELPDYHEIVRHPMDFGTVRKKLSSGAYGNLEQFEKDVFVICSNAMKYNAPDTIYFRQARSIQELAKKDFENLRQDSDDNESQPKVIRRGRPPTKNLKKRLGRPPLERAGSELSSDATLANAGDNNIGSNSYDLRRGPFSGKPGPADTSGRNYHGSHNSEAFAWLAEHKSEVNDEYPASLSKGISMKFGKKHYLLDENRRNTYRQSHPLAGGRSPSVLTTFDGEKKQLMAVGLHMEHGFARSLARFAATLGPIAWKIASKKIERALPAGVKFGPGWVGENEAPSSQSSLPIRSPAHVLPKQPFSPPKPPLSTTTRTMPDVKVDELPKREEPSNNSASVVLLNRTNSSSTSSSSLVGSKSCGPTTEHRETTAGLKSESGVSLLGSNNAGIRPNPPFQIHQGPVLYSSTSGFIGGCPKPALQMDKLIRPSPSNGGLTSTASIESQMHETVTRSSNNTVQSMCKTLTESEDREFSGCSNTRISDTYLVDPTGEAKVGTNMGLRQSSWQESSEHPKSDPVPPDLNVRFQSPGSPTCTQQPDLALQL